MAWLLIACLLVCLKGNIFAIFYTVGGGVRGALENMSLILNSLQGSEQILLSM